jgi:hypothetical protein
MSRPEPVAADQASRLALARAVRDACLRAALAECDDARMAGLCWEGAWEAAIGAVRDLDLAAIVSAAELAEGAHAQARDA